MLSERIGLPLVECRAVEPRTSPLSVGHTPTRARASVDLPDALGPDQTEALARLQLEPDRLDDRRLRAGRADEDVLHGEAALGRGRGLTGYPAPARPTGDVLEAAVALARADEALPVGDCDLDRSARGPATSAIEAAIIEPPDISPWMTMYAPRPRTADCRTIRKDLGEGADAGGGAARAQAVIDVADVSHGKRCARKVRIPSARTASALRRLVSASVCRSAALRVRSYIGARLRASV